MLLACSVSAFPSINFTSTSIGGVGKQYFFAYNCSAVPGLARGHCLLIFAHLHGRAHHLFISHVSCPPIKTLQYIWVSLITLVAWSKDLTFCELRIQGGGDWKFWRIWAFIEPVWPCPHPWVQKINMDQGAWFAPWKLTLAKARGSRGTPDKPNITRSQSKKFPSCTYTRGKLLWAIINALSEYYSSF